MDTDDAHSYPKELKNTVNRLNKRGEIFQLWTCSTTRDTDVAKQWTEYTF